jgi:heme O synthase-like polyprenyltransferase
MKVEPFSILAAILALVTFFIGGIIGNLILIVAAIFMSLSYQRFKKDSSYTTKWPLYVAAIVVLGTIFVKIILLSLL